MGRAASDDDVFQAIACPTRRALLDVLAHGERHVSDLVASLAITQSAVSQQLSILKSAGLVGERAVGRFRYYRLRAAPLTEVEVWLGRYRAHVERQLDAIGRVLDALPDQPLPTKPATSPTRRRSRKKSR
ncbi:MAG TPA: metalloregulator ArsR/SmtB family transcription factor [Polyangiaceae bacterium]|jgi:DNA-binding transcriptional ArsR family regulator